MNRRHVLLAGGSSIALLGTGTTALLDQRQLARGNAAWGIDTDALPDVRLKALAHAILAPSPHNRQPWKVQLVGLHGLTLSTDLERLLPKTDPFNRQITVGLGAFVEQLRIAASVTGHRLNIDWFPQGFDNQRLDQRPVASIEFIEDVAISKDGLADFILDRRTNRTPFSKEPLPDPAMSRVGTAASSSATTFDWTQDVTKTARVKSVCQRSWEVESNLPRTHHESVELTRIGATEVAEKPDGISLGGTPFQALKAMGVFTRQKMSDPTSFAFKSSQDFYSNLIDSATGFGWITTKANSRLDQVAAGASWIRLHLQATKEGLALQPLSQSLQEFPEMKKHYDDVHRLLGDGGQTTVQGLFRFGYADVPAPSPRWPLSSALVAHHG